MERYDSIDRAVSAVFGEGIHIVEKRITVGGDINRAYTVTLSDGRGAFLKENTSDHLDFFVKEAAGLEAIRKAGGFCVPELYAHGIDGSNAFLLMEQIKPGRRIPDYYEDFGRRLSAMHQSECSEYTGNFSGIQMNWIES